jgi:RNA polymerase sigma-70 factor (ECF subfamily)
MFGTSSDGAVIRRVLAGRHEDFAVLVARHMPMARALAWARLRHPQDVEDVVQEAFLKAYRSLDSLRDVRHFGAWLGAIVRNACVNVIRAQQVRNAAAAGTPDDAMVTPAIEQEEVRRLVRARLDDLDEASREILLFHYFAGKSTREIADVLNLSRDAVKKRMQRSRETLGQALLRDLSPTEAERQDREKQVRAVVAAIPLSSAPWAEASAATAVAGAVRTASTESCQQ